jgi:hypothetical protein
VIDGGGDALTEVQRIGSHGSPPREHPLPS